MMDIQMMAISMVTRMRILDDGSINNIDDGANMDGIDGSVEEAAPQDESAPDSDSEVVQ